MVGIKKVKSEFYLPTASTIKEVNQRYVLRKDSVCEMPPESFREIKKPADQDYKKRVG